MDAPGKGLVRYLSDPALCVQYGNLAVDNRTQGVGWSDLNSVRTAHVFAQNHPVRHLVRRTAPQIATGVRNVLDHLINLPKGIASEQIGFRAD